MHSHYCVSRQFQLDLDVLTGTDWRRWMHLILKIAVYRLVISDCPVRLLAQIRDLQSMIRSVPVLQNYCHNNYCRCSRSSPTLDLATIVRCLLCTEPTRIVWSTRRAYCQNPTFSKALNLGCQCQTNSCKLLANCPVKKNYQLCREIERSSRSMNCLRCNKCCWCNLDC